MSLTLQIDADLKKAMIAKEADKLSVLRMLKSAIKYAAVDKIGADGVLPDSDVITVVRKELKKRQDSIESFTSANRPDLANKEILEAKFLEAYLPAALSTEQVEAYVKEAILEVGATSKAQMGLVMKAVQAKVAGQADGKTISQIVQKLLP